MQRLKSLTEVEAQELKLLVISVSRPFAQWQEHLLSTSCRRFIIPGRNEDFSKDLCRYEPVHDTGTLLWLDRIEAMRQEMVECAAAQWERIKSLRP